MSHQTKNSISRKGLSEEFKKGEEQVSGLILEGYLLKQRERFNDK